MAVRQIDWFNQVVTIVFNLCPDVLDKTEYFGLVHTVVFQAINHSKIKINYIIQ